MKALILTLFLTLAAPAVFAQKVIGIADGDTLTLLIDRKPLKVRLANIDAPERSQAFGERARQSLSDLCFGKEASYERQDMDQYGRVVALVTCNGVEANRTQVERGMAWVYPKFTRNPALVPLQEQARRGLWTDNDPVAPWDYRRSAKKSRRDAVTSME
jgi:micrococcal nuclease